MVRTAYWFLRTGIVVPVAAPHVEAPQSKTETMSGATGRSPPLIGNPGLEMMRPSET